MKKVLFIFALTAMASTLAAQCNSKPYEISFDIVEKESGQFFLVVNVDLAEGSYFVSPYSNDTFSGRFGVKLESGKTIQLGESFEETPRSKEIYDAHPFVKGYVNWVREDTQYEYPLIIEELGDFGVVGEVRFVIEPKCTMERIPFIIKRVNGKLVVGRDMC